MKRFRFLTAIAGAALLVGGCPQMPNQPADNTKDFTAFVKDIVSNDAADSDPVSIDGLDFTFDEDDAAFADLFAQVQS